MKEGQNSQQITTFIYKLCILICMAKVHKDISIDFELNEKLKELDLNFSQFVNDQLRGFLLLKEGNITEINIKIKEKRLNILEKEFNNLSLEISKQRESINEYKKQEQEKEKINLENEAERLKLLKTCKVCMQLLHDKDKKVEWSKGLFIHASCLSNLTKEAKERLNQKNEV